MITTKMKAPITSSIPFNSTALDQAYYNSYDELLYIEFKNGGVRMYEGVDQSLWDSFTETRSAGHFYADRVKGVFKSTDLGSYLGIDFVQDARMLADLEKPQLEEFEIEFSGTTRIKSENMDEALRDFRQVYTDAVTTRITRV